MQQHPIDAVTDQIIRGAITVHKKYGPGLLESVYNVALGLELVAMGLEVEIGKPLSLEHQGVEFNRAYVVDLLVNETVIVELKCVKRITEVDVAQLLTYLRLMNLRVGLILNFNVTKLVHGIRRVVNRHVDEDGNLLAVTGREESVEDVKKAADGDPKQK
jgi:GxxExxY protein